MKEEHALFHPVSIGSLTVDGNLFLAPLAGYTDRSFRSLCVDKGASLTYTEMVSGEGLARNNGPTKALLRRADNEQLLAVQLFMGDAEVIKRSVDNLLAYNPSAVDINCGCPVPKVVKTGAGSALLKEPQKIYEIVRALKTYTNLPVSVKIRLGWDSSSINYDETSDAAIDAGVDMICMHARTRAMGYSGVADWSALSDLKKRIHQRSPHIPLFGSGDLFSGEDALAMLKETQVDGVMFARGAMGNPYIFEEAKTLFTNKPYHPPTREAKLEMMLRHLRLLAKDVGEESSCKLMRKHAPGYLKGLPNASLARQQLVMSITFEDYERVVQNILSSSES